MYIGGEPSGAERRSEMGSHDRQMGRLQSLRGELDSIRGRFRDVKIAEVEQQAERQRMEEAEEAARKETARAAVKPHEAYFAKFQEEKERNSRANSGRNSKPEPPARRGRGFFRGAPPADPLEGLSPAERAKAYFEHRRRDQEPEWEAQEEDEARKYFEEKRKMADAAFRMQHMMDAHEQPWRKEWEESKRGGGGGKGGKGKGKEGGVKAAQPQQKQAQQEAARATGYLLPWGPPKPVRKPAQQQNKKELRQLQQGSGAASAMAGVNHHQHEMEARSAIPSSDSVSPSLGSLPVSFHPVAIPDDKSKPPKLDMAPGLEAYSLGLTSDKKRGFDYSHLGFGTIPSFEPLSPRGDPWGDLTNERAAFSKPKGLKKKQAGSLALASLSNDSALKKDEREGDSMNPDGLAYSRSGELPTSSASHLEKEDMDFPSYSRSGELNYTLPTLDREESSMAMAFPSSKLLTMSHQSARMTPTLPTNLAEPYSMSSISMKSSMVPPMSELPKLNYLQERSSMATPTAMMPLGEPAKVSYIHAIESSSNSGMERKAFSSLGMEPDLLEDARNRLGGILLKSGGYPAAAFQDDEGDAPFLTGSAFVGKVKRESVFDDSMPPLRGVSLRRDDTDMPSPPMALQVLGPRNKVQELML